MTYFLVVAASICFYFALLSDLSGVLPNIPGSQSVFCVAPYLLNPIMKKGRQTSGFFSEKKSELRWGKLPERDRYKLLGRANEIM